MKLRCCCPVNNGEGVTDERSRHSIYPPNILHALWPISTISSRPTLLVNVLPTIHYCPSILFHRRFSSALRRETSLADRPLRERRSNAVTTHSHILTPPRSVHAPPGRISTPTTSVDPWTSTRRDTVPRPGQRKADPAARILRGTVVLIHRAGPAVVVRARAWEEGRVGARRPSPSLGRSSSRVYGSPRRRRHHGVGWSRFEVRSASIESPIGWEMWAPGGCWGEGGSVSRLGENGEP